MIVYLLIALQFCLHKGSFIPSSGILLYFTRVIMAALCNRAGHYICSLWFLLLLSFFSPNLSGRSLDVYHTWCGPCANLECMSEMC